MKRIPQRMHAPSASFSRACWRSIRAPASITDNSCDEALPRLEAIGDKLAQALKDAIESDDVLKTLRLIVLE